MHDNQKGFTLVEILAVLVILGIIVGIAAVKFVRVDDGASNVALKSGVSELNSREHLVWINAKMSEYNNDSDVFDVVDYDLGSDYSWSTGPLRDGGTLVFNGVSKTLVRTPSTADTQAIWEME